MHHQQQTTNIHIGIAGAGIMGRMLAWQCMKSGMRVSLFDKNSIECGDAAAYTAAGMLAPYCEVESADLMVFHLGMQALRLWKDMHIELKQQLAYQQHGSLIISHQNDEPDYQHFKHIVRTKLSPSPEQLQELTATTLQTLEPELSQQFEQALYLPEEAWLCPRRTLQALAHDLLANNIDWHCNTDITNIQAHEICTNEKSHHFDVVVDARGLGAKPQWQEVRGVRGELIALQAPDVTIKHMIRLMHPRYPLYLVPKGYDNIYTIGATQIESSDRGPISVRSSLELLSAAYSIHSGFAEARIIESRTNCRPSLLDNLPRIIHEDGLFRVNGLFRHGFLISPVLAQEIIQYILNPNYQSSFNNLIQEAA